MVMIEIDSLIISMHIELKIRENFFPFFSSYRFVCKIIKKKHLLGIFISRFLANNAGIYLQ